MDGHAAESDSSFVDPEVRAHVYSLVTAVGGTSATAEGRYVLGDEALACLKDVKRWLQLYDGKLGRLDVARCLAEANLVEGDLLEILASWHEDEIEDKLRSKISLACLEILVHLSWPIEKNEERIDAHYFGHIPFLEFAQIHYKRGILEHSSSTILRTVLRLGLLPMSVPIADRSLRDEGIIKLVLYLLRNVAIISSPPYLPVEWNENEVSRSATVKAFKNQDVFPFLLAIASGIGGDFKIQDVVLLELLFHLVKGVDVRALFLDERDLRSQQSTKLRNLMAKEADMLNPFYKDAPSRHNRFGTMIWVSCDEEKKVAVSGQDIVNDGQKSLNKMDRSKKWNRPKYNKREEETPNRIGLVVPLDESSRGYMRDFVKDFLDSGFNPLFDHLRRSISREADRVLAIHNQQFFYTLGWFLQAARERRKREKRIETSSDSRVQERVSDGFGIVASVLNQETFVLLGRYIQKQIDEKSWPELKGAMRSFTQILLTVQDMAESELEEDQEIAENIQNRIFYEETTHDQILRILREYNGQGFDYLDAVTELSHVFIRMLERYSKANADLQIRSRRRAAKKKNISETAEEGQGGESPGDSEAEEIAETQRVSKERRFDFRRFAGKFATQACVDTFVKFTAFFKDMTDEQLKRAHRFFYRIGFKQEASVVLFRVDILALFHRMILGPDGMSTTSPMFREWKDFVIHLFRGLTKKLKERPELYVELLFSKMGSSVFYLEYGFDKDIASSNPRPAAELEVKGGFDVKGQIGVLVAVLLNEGLDTINFVKHVLKSATDERRSWEMECVARQELEGSAQSKEGETAKPTPLAINITADHEERRIALLKNAKLRLLLTLCGATWIEEDGLTATWTIPSYLSSEILQEKLECIENHLRDPVEMYGDDKSVPAEDMLRRKSTAKAKRAGFDYDSGGDPDIMEDEDFLFPAGGPTITKRKALENLKRKRKSRMSEQSDQELESEDEEAADSRREARKIAELNRRRKIKSDLFVHDSDDESDEERDREFLKKEEERREVQAAKVAEALRLLREEEVGSNKRKGDSALISRSKRRKTEGTNDSSGISDADSSTESVVSNSLPRNKELEESEEEEDETPLSSQIEGHAKHGEETASSKTDNPTRDEPSEGDFANQSDSEPSDGEQKRQDNEQPNSSNKTYEAQAAMETRRALDDDDVFGPAESRMRQRRKYAILDDSSDEE